MTLARPLRGQRKPRALGRADSGECAGAVGLEFAGKDFKREGQHERTADASGSAADVLVYLPQENT